MADRRLQGDPAAVGVPVKVVEHWRGGSFGRALTGGQSRSLGVPLEARFVLVTCEIT